MQLSQDDALGLLVLLAALNEADSWLVMQKAGLFDGPERPLIPDVRLDLDTYGYAYAVKDFRFDVHGIRLLVHLCAMPDTVITEAGDRCLAEEALAVMLYRLSYPSGSTIRWTSSGAPRQRSVGSSCGQVCVIVRRNSDVVTTTSPKPSSRHFCISQRSQFVVRHLAKGTNLKTCNAKYTVDTSVSTVCFSKVTATCTTASNCFNAIQYCVLNAGLTAPYGLCIHFLDSMKADATIPQYLQQVTSSTSSVGTLYSMAKPFSAIRPTLSAST
ncbi:unnamed protein product [Phytophthora fragariaefolia]|uniref:Unnamed protein product n=1 Tax=Phytophthora fragariaefolia TaxID=1490495 RepID=A0A9W6YDA0_9STRA|nr:unnamed protein product [Phytophthora fragariaefolia]